MINFNRKNKRAFTLIEISIVLVIIGIILASVMKGRDMIKSSQIKEFNQVFVSQWETIANSYFSRMGAVLEDGGANGGAVGTTTTDGFMDNEAIGTDTKAILVVDALKTAGIDPCTLVKSDISSTTDYGCQETPGDSTLNVFQRTVDGEYVGKSTVQLLFANIKIDGKLKNALVFTGMPEDVAQALDTIRDGSPNGKTGTVLRVAAVTNIGGTTKAATDSGTSSWDGDATSTTNMVILLEH
ncbi:MAG: prepilin-type N-terminal cleavage/methylation domain-containing protein [Campylobacterota bacterium]|nr:prepilin-type N-terminal cleavage/methylation domain-containing protein [Campylobacterota bacterium]